MVQYQRLTSDSSLIDYIKSIDRKVDGVATQGSGDIILTDPNSGVETILGTLPDGTVGLDQFVNDVIPPGAPATPTATGTLESATITWDGLQADGAAQPRDYSRTTIEMQVDGGIWTPVGTVYGETSFIVNRLQPNVAHSFRMKSYDQKNNESEPSAIVTATPTGILDNTEVDTALGELRQADVSLGETASQAAEDASQALQDLVNLNAELTAHPTTFYGATEPTATAERPFVVGDWWVDTDDSNKLYVWNGNDFVVSADPSKALSDLGINQTWVNEIEAQADRAIDTFFGTDTPTGMQTGDLWLTGVAGQPMKRWNGSSWADFEDPNVKAAYQEAIEAQTAANKAIESARTYINPLTSVDGVTIVNGVTPTIVDSPTAMGGKALRKTGTGNGWYVDRNAKQAFDPTALYRLTVRIRVVTPATTGGGLVYTGVQGYAADGTTLVNANGDNTSSSQHYFFSENMGPTDGTWKDFVAYFKGNAVGASSGGITALSPRQLHANVRYFEPLVILDYNNGNGVWEVSHWSIDVIDAAGHQALVDAGNASGLAKTKIRTFAQNAAPSGLTADNTGDLWINTTAGDINGQVKRWDGDSWELIIESGKNATNSVLAALGINQAWVDTVEAQADRAIATFYGTAAPTGMETGDLWLTGVAGEAMKRWDGDSWEVFEDPNVQNAYQKAGEALNAADSKILTHTGTTAPTGLESPASDGDLWINTSTGSTKGQISRFFNNAWTLVTDNGQAAADAALAALGINQTWVSEIETQADRAIATFYGTDTPTGMQAGDLWVSGTAGVPMKRWDGDSWEDFEDPNVKAAYGLANQAKTDANAKILTYALTSAPSGLTTDNDGDLWINTTAGPLYGQIKRYSHPNWVLVSDNGVLASQNTVAFSGNPSFDDWTGTYPAGYTLYGTQGPTKETTILTKGSATSTRWNITTATTQAGLQFSGGTIAGHLPNVEYYTIELDFYLVSGSLAGAGIILDWNGTSMANNRVNFALTTDFPTITTGKWHRLTKVVRRPTNITGTWSSMGGFVMANWSAFTNGVKDIIFDWFNIRPSTNEEVKAYLAPTTADVAAKGKVIIQSAAPATADRLVQNLWIDTTPIGSPASPGNIPKRWNSTSSQWEAVSDKGIQDAAATAVAAQGAANQAAIDAGLALTAANARNRIIHLNTTPAVPTDGWKNGDTWFKHATADVSSEVVEWYRWSTADNAWKLQEFAESFLPQVNIGTGTYGSMSGVRLEAGTIEVTKLAVSDFTNLWPNPRFTKEADGSIFYYIGNDYTGPEVAPVAGNIRTLSGRDHVGSAGNITAKFGDSFLVEADVKRTAGAVALMAGVWAYKANGTVTTAGFPFRHVVAEPSATDLGNGWSRHRWIVKPDNLPTDTASVRIYFQIDQDAAAPTTTWLVSNAALRRRGGGELIVDGAIDGRTIIGASIQSTKDVDRGIKFTSTELAGWDTNGQKNFSLSSAGVLDIRGTIKSGSSIEAATLVGNGIQTSNNATTGVKVTSAGIKAYNTIGELSFNLDAATGMLEVPGIKAKSIQVDRLVLSSVDNLIVEADFTNGGKNWEFTANNSLNATAGRGGRTAMRVTGTANAVSFLNLQNKFAVEPDRRFRGSISVKSDSQIPISGVAIYLRCYTTTNTYTTIQAMRNTTPLTSNNWHIVTGISPVLPEGTIAIEASVRVWNDNASAITDIDQVSLTRAYDGTLLVDGAINGQKVIGANIMTNEGAGTPPIGGAPGIGGIVLDKDKFAAYAPTGAETFNINASTGAVTSSGTFKTTTVQKTETTGATLTLSGLFGTLSYERYDEFTGVPGIQFNNVHSTDGDQTPGSLYFDGKSIIMTTSDLNFASAPNDSSAEVRVGEGYITLSGYANDDTVPNKQMPFPILEINAGEPNFRGTEGVNMSVTYSLYDLNNTNYGFAGVRANRHQSNLGGPGNPFSAQLYNEDGGLMTSSRFEAGSTGRWQILGTGSNGYLKTLISSDYGDFDSKLYIGSKSTVELGDANGNAKLLVNSSGVVVSGSLTYPRRLKSVMTFSNGWTNFSTGYQAAYVVESAPDIVTFSGMIKGGTLTDGIQVGTLSTGFRPTVTHNMPCVIRTSTPTNVAGIVSVDTAGAVRVFGVTSTTSYVMISVSYFKTSTAS